MRHTNGNSVSAIHERFSAAQRIHFSPTAAFRDPSCTSSYKIVRHSSASSFLYQESWATDLERMAPQLWMMSTQSSSNISALHRQKVKGRAIVVTEDPRLHLVWIYDRVFVKPLPRYLLSHLFWSQFLSTEQSILRGRSRRSSKFMLGYGHWR